MKAKSKTLSSKSMKKTKGGAAAELAAIKKTAVSDSMSQSALAIRDTTATANASADLEAMRIRGKR